MVPKDEILEESSGQLTCQVDISVPGYLRRLVGRDLEQWGVLVPT